MDDSYLLKFIVEELAKEPFNLNYNIASFGSLTGKTLLHVLKTILEDISPKYKEEIGAEGISHLNSVQTLDLLRVLRYLPMQNDPESIQDGLEGPVPEIIWEIIYWLLSKREELKQRGYLAQFLVKVPIPDEILIDGDVEMCYEQYENEIDDFKKTHKSLQDINKENDTRPVSELVNDLEKINHDIECLGRKVETLKNRVSDFPEKEELLGKSKIIRKAREEKLKLESQMREEELKLIQATRKVDSLFNRYKDIRSMSQHSTPEGALERAEQDCEVLKYIVEQRLPYKIEEIERAVLAMTITEGQPPECLADLEYNRLKFEEICREIIFYENKIRSKELDPSVNFARQQSLNNQKKKLELSEDMEIMKDDLTNIRERIETKRQQKFGCKDDLQACTAEGFRDYLKELRVKAAQYKSKKHELHALQAEVGHLSTTKYILEGEIKSSEENLEIMEEKLGLVGFAVVSTGLENLSSKKSGIEHKKMDTIYQMATLAKTLNDKVHQRKSELEPLIKDVRAERQALQDLEDEAKQLKDVMDREMNPINETITRLEKHFDQLLLCCQNDELQFTQINSEIPIMKVNLRRAKDIVDVNELKAPMPRVRTFREKLLAKIMESELTQQSLNKELAHLDETQEFASSQQQMWMDLHEVLKLKFEIQQGNFTGRDVEEEERDDIL